PVDPSLDRLVPADMARTKLAVAVETDGGELVVAMADPSDGASVREIEEATGWKVRPAIAEREELRRLVHAMYGREPEPAAGAGRADMHDDLEISIAEEPTPVVGPEVVG